VKEEAEIETRVDAYGEEGVTKTTAGMRTIPLSQPLVLKEWKLRTKRKKPEDLVFPNKRGWYIILEDGSANSCTLHSRRSSISGKSS
jgi:hypothetical protein